MDRLEELENLTKSFNWAEPSWSLFILLAWVGLAVLYALASGRGRVMSMLVAIYAGQLIAIKVPFLQKLVADKLPVHTESLQQLVVFSAIFLIIFFALSKYSLKTSAESRGAGLVFGVIFSLLQVGLLIHTTLILLPNHVKQDFAPLISRVFLDSGAGIFWLVTPLAFLILFGRFVSGRQD